MVSASTNSSPEPEVCNTQGTLAEQSCVPLSWNMITLVSSGAVRGKRVTAEAALLAMWRSRYQASTQAARLPVQWLPAWPAAAEEWQHEMRDIHVNVWDTDSEDDRYDEESYGDDDGDMSYEDDEAPDNIDSGDW